MWMLGILHYKDVHNHPIDYLYLSIGLGVEGNQFGWWNNSTQHKWDMRVVTY